MLEKIKNQKGLTALLTIVVISVAALLMAYSASFLSLGELEMGFTSQQGAETFDIADGCVEEAYQQIRRDNSYTGGTFSLGSGNCNVAVSISGSDRTVTATGTLDAYYKVIQTNITIIGRRRIQVNSWQEITN